MITFGPVPSRRLGKSLGINNILKPKICSYGCLYCQVGVTRNKSIRRAVFFEPSYILDEVRNHLDKLDENNKPDWLTFVSNGEPTLDINLGISIDLLKPLGYPVAVITNASLLYDKEVRDDLNKADWVSVKADAPDNETWQKINQPHNKLSFSKYLEGLGLFASGYKALLNTETMLVNPVNDNESAISEIAAIIYGIKPKRSYISIPIRPPATAGIGQPSPEILNMAWNIFKNKGLDTELLTGFEGTDTGFTGNIYEDILNTTAVHPLRHDSMEELLSRDNADKKVIESLLSQKLIKRIKYNGMFYYLREYRPPVK